MSRVPWVTSSRGVGRWFRPIGDVPLGWRPFPRGRLRQDSGTYYTPVALVEEMVRFTDDVLRESLVITEGFASSEVYTVDPAMGTGTFLQSVVERVRRRVTETTGAGAVSGALTQLATRIAGLELQMGPFAVAEMRVAELLADSGASIPKGGLHLYVTDTLDDPYADLTHIASGLQTIAKSRKRANELKRSRKVNVVIGNHRRRRQKRLRGLTPIEYEAIMNTDVALAA